MKKICFASLFLLYLTRIVRNPANAQIFAQAASLIPSREIIIVPSSPAVQTILQGTAAGREWAYLVPFPVKNSSTIETLISCESQGVNVSRPDSNGRMSDGILQFNRGPSDVLGSGTWDDMAARFHLGGSPINPPDAIRMADAMISGGFLSRWTCATLTGLIQ